MRKDCAPVAFSTTPWAEALCGIIASTVIAMEGRYESPTSVPPPDIANSKACTQSGAFALLLSVAILLLIPHWWQRPWEIALAAYISDRANLANELATLDDNPTWQKYQNANKSADSTPFEQLLERSYLVYSSSSRDVSKKKPTETKLEAHQTAKKSTPRIGPVTGLSATAVEYEHLPELRSIADLLTKLNDPQLLTNSMRESNFFTFSILSWGQKRNALMYRNVVLNSCVVTRLEIPTIAPGAPKPDYFAPLLDNDAMLKCLSLQDIRQLAKLELPTFPNPLQLGGRIQQEIVVNPWSLSASLFPISLIAQLLLFFVLVYFGAFASEAVSSATFPTPGTLFAAFSRSRWLLFAIFIAIWIPLAASLAMSVVSHKWQLMACNVPILIAVLFIQSVLRRKSYFGSLLPGGGTR